MSAADLVPRQEPASLHAGLTWQWRREDLADYPADTYALKYAFRGASSGFSVTASADGMAFAVSIAAATTATYAAGSYTGVGWVESGSTKIEVWRGRLDVRPALDTGDGRSHVRKVLDAIESVLEGRASRSDRDYEVNTGSGSRRLSSFTPEELILLRETYKRYEVQELAALRVASGLGGGRKVVTRFVRPQ